MDGSKVCLLHPYQDKQPGEPTTPKGIDPLTLKMIECVFATSDLNGLNAAEIGKKTGVSRTTARRYRKYLTSTGQLSAELIYSAVERPERRYFPI